MKDEFTPLINAMKTASAAGLMQVAVNLNDRAEPFGASSFNRSQAGYV